MPERNEQFRTDFIHEASELHDQDDVMLYVKESEHQDGLEYWSKFQTVEQAICDFQLYVEAIQD